MLFIVWSAENKPQAFSNSFAQCWVRSWKSALSQLWGRGKQWDRADLQLMRSLLTRPLWYRHQELPAAQPRGCRLGRWGCSSAWLELRELICPQLLWVIKWILIRLPDSSEWEGTHRDDRVQVSGQAGTETLVLWPTELILVLWAEWLEQHRTAWSNMQNK